MTYPRAEAEFSPEPTSPAYDQLGVPGMESMTSQPPESLDGPDPVTIYHDIQREKGLVPGIGLAGQAESSLDGFDPEPDPAVSAPESIPEAEDASTAITPEERERRLALRDASVFFKDVSERYNSSVTAQGLALARRCQRESKSPEKLGDVLLADPKRIEGLAKAATHQHAAALAKVQAEKEAEGEGTQTELPSQDRSERKTLTPPTHVISPRRISDIATRSFGLASEAMILTDAQIQAGLDLYPAADEFDYRNTVRDMLLQRRRELAAANSEK